MRNFFTGCMHFGHANIIKYCNRPFKSLKEMNETLIKNWNERVKQEDIVFNVGDFCFKNTPNCIAKGEGDIHNAQYYESQLNGKIIHIKGNHDSHNSCKTCIRNLHIILGGYTINLVHNPKYVDFNADFNIVSHVHNKFKIKRYNKGKKTTLAINVGVDQWDFRPIMIEDILKNIIRFEKQEKSKLNASSKK